ncbi:biotin carboxyl carrier protein [Hypnocyclicus thermotrophus]|uniref:Biotin carboxyl carrier protein n=1 Tax=Hypnocyclicus thermotrophus TaxID=1627895 RepID=A0AA46DX55_9FUSO|nr:biotin/lipoyl-containing protein [Hypnocyclicus thermotrophus]TDT67853.1 biotin carboxyl carrier protein [Hypnocyclicus thermotrophus]
MEFKEIKNIINILNETDLIEIDVTFGKERVFIKKDNVVKQVLKSTKAPKKEEMSKKELIEIKSQNVGNIILLNKTGEPIVKKGQSIKEGEVLAYIESVGLKAEVKSPVNGIISDVLLADGDLADYGKILFLIEKA